MQSMKLMQPESILVAQGSGLLSGWEELVREGGQGGEGSLFQNGLLHSLVRKREGGEAGKFASPLPLLPPLLRLVLMGAIFRGQQSH